MERLPAFFTTSSAAPGVLSISISLYGILCLSRKRLASRQSEHQELVYTVNSIVIKILKQTAGIQKPSGADHRSLLLRGRLRAPRRLRLKAPLQLQDRLLEQLPGEGRYQIQQRKLPYQSDRITHEPVLQTIAPAKERPSFVVRKEN